MADKRFKFTVKVTNLYTGENYTEKLIQEAPDADTVCNWIKDDAEYFDMWECGNVRIEIFDLRTMTGLDVIAECLQIDTGTTEGNRSMLKTIALFSDDDRPEAGWMDTNEMIAVLDER